MIDQKTLAEYLRFEPATGSFYWIKRSSDKTKVGSVAGRQRSPGGYWQLTLLGKTYYVHRLAWFYVNGEWPPAQIDHANGNKSDNRISNLRKATHSQNLANIGAKRDNTSGSKNVHWCNTKQRWIAKVKRDGKTIHVGTFRDFDAATEASRAARVKVFGEFSSDLGRDAAAVASKYRGVAK